MHINYRVRFLNFEIENSVDCSKTVRLFILLLFIIGLLKFTPKICTSLTCVVDLNSVCILWCSYINESSYRGERINVS